MSTGTLHFDGNHYIPLRKGETFDALLTWKDGDGNPIDLTSYSAKMQVRKNYGATLVLELSTDNGRIVLGGTDGTIQLIIPSVDTTGLLVGDFMYDLVLTIGDTKQRLLEGKFNIKDRITE